MEDPA
jgi:hypothetical protein